MDAGTWVHCTPIIYCEHYLCRSVIKKHKYLGAYVEVFALCDIDKYDELFARYGYEYWCPKDPEKERPVEEPHILDDDEYEHELDLYEEAIRTLTDVK